MSVTSLRYAHTEGHCNINYVPNTKVIATCGADGEVRVFTKGITEDDSNSHLIGDEVYAMKCTSQNKVYVAPSGTNTIRAYTIDEGVNDGLVARFTADITCMNTNNDKGDILVAGSADMTVKVINTESYEVIATFEGHSAPILSVSLDTQGLFVASSSCDGTIRIWSIKEKRQIKEIHDVLPKSNDFSNSVTLAEVSWKPGKESIQTLAVAHKTSVSIFQNKGESSLEWTKIRDLKPQKTVLQSNEYINVVSFSKLDNGSYLAGGTTKGNIFVWHLTGNVILESKSTSEHEYGICSIDFSPIDSTEAAFIDCNGYWGIIENIPSKGSANNQPKTTKEKGPASSKVLNENELDADELAAALFEDDDDDDNENSFSIRKIKAETGFLNDEADENDDETASTFGDKYVGDNIQKNDADSVADQDVNQMKLDILNNEPSSISAQRQRNIDFEVQEPFQPGSTPVHLQSRFMVWNSVGIVKAFSSDDEKSIDVEFHDTAIHHPIHLSNMRGYTMAALTDRCLVLACDADDVDSADEENSDSVKSKLLCHYFGSSDISKEWSLEMPNREEIMAVACGDGWIAVATDRRNLRIFSCGGMQLEVLSLPGPVVSLAGYKKEIAITVHLGLGLPGNQSIGIAIFTVGEKNHQLPYYSHLPLAPKSVLSWIGFTDQGTPCIMDSAGFIRILNGNYGAGGWMQVCNTKALVKGKSDHFFIVGVNERSFSARAILVKGSRFPQTVPRPVVALINLSIPLCTSTVTEKDTLEAEFWKCDAKSRAFEGYENEIDEDISTNKDAQNQCLVKLFALACKSDHESRAIEVCKLMDLQTIQVAIQYASKIRRLQLATKISELAGIKQDEETRLLNARRNIDHDRKKGNDEDNESQDMFYPTQAEMQSEDVEEKTPTNPFLAAKFRKENSYSAQARLQSSNNSFSPDIGDNRNPFKKNLTPQSSNIRSGLVFDGISKEEAPRKGSQNGNNAFGSRPPVKLPTNGAISKHRQQMIKQKFSDDKNQTTGKENKLNNSASEIALKGFQLWFEENKDNVSQKAETNDPTTVQNLGLQQWKSMTKMEKEKYKEPRTPNLRQGKRKYEATEAEVKTLSNDDQTRTSIKLAKFSAPE